MDILLQLQSARKHKTIYGCIENVPVNNLSRALIELNFQKALLYSLPIFEKALNDYFYVAGIIDKSFCNRKVALTVPYDDFCRVACGPDGVSGID